MGPYFGSELKRRISFRAGSGEACSAGFLFGVDLWRILLEGMDQLPGWFEGVPARLDLSPGGPYVGFSLKGWISFWTGLGETCSFGVQLGVVYVGSKLMRCSRGCTFVELPHLIQP